MEARDLTLQRVGADLFESVTTLDAGAIRSFRLLITRPGFLTAELAAGRTRPYLSPLSLFLIANLLYFLIGSLGMPVATFGTPLRVHFGQILDAPAGQVAPLAEDAGWRGRLLARRIRSEGWSDISRVEAQFDVHVEQQAKAFMIVLTPAFALLVALMRIRRREPGGLHLVFALHYLALSLLLFVGVGFVLAGVRWAIPDRFNGDSPWIPVAIVVVLTGYLIAAFRRAYGSRLLTAVPQAIVLAGSWVYVLDLYRALLYVTALNSV